MKAAIVAALLLVAGARVAAAQPAVRVHAEAAVSVLGGADHSSTAFRGYLGFAVHDHVQGVRPFLGGGVHVGAGALYVPDPRALDQDVELSFHTLGPEVRAGLAVVGRGYFDPQLYVAYAPIAVTVDPRLMINTVDHVHGGRGFRAGIGITYASAVFGAIGHAFASGTHDETILYAAFLPDTLELTFERSTGSDRMGASFGWGF